MATNASQSDVSGAMPSCGIYVAAVGAAFITTFFDDVRNSNISALKKTTIAVREMIKISDTSAVGPTLVSIILFCALAALLVFVYRPKETKESFLLGLSVLVVAGLASPPPINTGVESVKSAHSDQSALFGLLPFSSALAQSEAQKEGHMVWIFLEGPGQHQLPETRVEAYSNGNLTINTMVNTAFYLKLPPGKHQIEISHLGYRSTSFEISSSDSIEAYKVPMKKVSFDSLSNFFGAQTISVQEDTVLTEAVTNAISECKRNNYEAAAVAARRIGVDKEKLQRETRRLICL